MGSGKGGGGGQAYNYFGDVAAVVGWGLHDSVTAILADGKAIYEGTATRSGDEHDFTSLIDAKWFSKEEGGYLKLLWGTSTQTIPHEFEDLPNYRGVCVLLAHQFLFGKDKTTPPNIEVIRTRKPTVDTALVASEDNILDDGQANPVAALAEIYCCAHGLGLPTSRLVAADWLAAAAWCNATSARRALTFCSPRFTEAPDARTLVPELLMMFDGAHYFDAQGRLGLRLLQPGVNPGGLATLDASTWAEAGAPKMECKGWGEVKTRLNVEFFDRARKFKKVPASAQNLLAARVLGLNSEANVPRLHITREPQASAWAAQLIRRASKVSNSGSLSVRRGFAIGLTPGKKVFVDMDPEPGGSGLAQLCVIEERREPPTGPIKLTVRADALSAAVIYTPAYGVAAPEANPVPGITHALIVPLPPLGWPGPLAFAVFATRPINRGYDLTGFRVFFDADDAGSFADLGDQPNFATRCGLVTAVDEAATVLRFEILDGAASPDAYLAGLTPGAAVGAQQDELVAVVANLDGDGQVVVGADGDPELEFMSVVSRSAVTSARHDYTVLRARRAGRPFPWSTSASVWLIPGKNLVAWTHPDLVALLAVGTPGYVRLAAFRPDAEDEATLPEFTFVVPPNYNLAPVITWTSPSGSSATADSSGNYTPAATVTDRDGNLVRLVLFSRRNDTGVVTIHADAPFVACATKTLAAALAEAGVSTPLNFAGRTGADTVYALTLRAIDKEGNQVDGTRTISRGPVSGSSPTPPLPTFDPAGTDFYGSISVGLTVVSPATQIHWLLTGSGSAEPTSYNTHTGMNKTVAVVSTSRLWARASTGTQHSAWLAADYLRTGSSQPF